jgi:hypothetical protein
LDSKQRCAKGEQENHFGHHAARQRGEKHICDYCFRSSHDDVYAPETVVDDQQQPTGQTVASGWQQAMRGPSRSVC